jgi:MFS transporter, ACS family, solute carrier family 17 (sodium-dependent inorganic phosphate cotransporter), other
MQSIGFLGPAFFLTQLSHVKTPALAVLCMACSQVCYIFFLGFFKDYSNTTVALTKELMDQSFLIGNLLINIYVYYLFFQGSDAFSQSGLYSNHQDIGPRYAVNHCLFCCIILISFTSLI